MQKSIHSLYQRTAVMQFFALTLIAVFTFSCDSGDEKPALPTILSVSPAQAEVGETVTITGTNLSAVTAVKFNATTATIDSKSATTIVTKVPAGATSGKISVTAPAGSASSAADFTVVVAPTIASFSPAKAEQGDDVTITGTNLDAVTAVEFNGKIATIKSKTATSLVATVPAAVTYGKIKVTAPAGSALSADKFAFISTVTISTFEEATAADDWKKAEDAGDIIVSEVAKDGDNNVFHLKGSDTNQNYWVGGRYHEINLETPVGVTEPELTQVWMNVDVKSNIDLTGIAAHHAKLVFAVKENGAPDNRRNYERDFPVSWSGWKTISIRADKFHYYVGGANPFTTTLDKNADITTIWSLALYLAGGSTTVYDFSWDNLTFSTGEPLGEEVPID
jgi:hypothetical protein